MKSHRSHIPARRFVICSINVFPFLKFIVLKRKRLLLAYIDRTPKIIECAGRTACRQSTITKGESTIY